MILLMLDVKHEDGENKDLLMMKTTVLTRNPFTKGMMM